ncbi:3-hydroxylacyl-ACP dehydratase [Paucibacter sp. KBW04]|uniref:ApeP family dehydratase n=1 Tax=Paucibacter sp. KBW04 TaxID=2153361 RepID=UPI000F581984|nr:3-hydroxylacyl-ACP dehydratase [Paucibacter sp. KBW04]RQO55862.1 3-hydroxylacyl-ACP dehydratase [Paucibacter sp. KBW04]
MTTLETADAQAWDVRELVPHAGRMSLLSGLLSHSGESLEAEVRISDDDLFFDPQLGGVGAWLGIEYMAQAVAAWAGLQGRQRGEAPKIGFLLGSRKYTASRSVFALGDVLRVQVRREFQADNGLGQFEGQILIGDEPVAQARLTVFGPPDPQRFLKDGDLGDE